MSRDRPDFMDWFEAWLNGYNAARAGVPPDADGICTAARQGFENCGAERARKLIATLAVLSDQEPTGGEG